MSTQLELSVEPTITYTGPHKEDVVRGWYYVYTWKNKSCETHISPGFKNKKSIRLEVLHQIDNERQYASGGFHTKFAIAALAGLKTGPDRAWTARELGFESWEELIDHMYAILDEYKRHSRKLGTMFRKIHKFGGLNLKGEDKTMADKMQKEMV